MNKFDKFFNLLMEDLNPEQKKLTDRFTELRAKNLSFRSGF